MAKIANSVPLGGFIAPNDSADTYATHDEQYGRGGFRSVATTTERDAIPTDRRKEGMEVKVLADGKKYELVGGIANSNWQEVVSGVDEAQLNTAVSNAVATEVPTVVTPLLADKADVTALNTEKARIDTLVTTAPSSFYEECLSTDAGALEVVADESTPTATQIKLASVTPLATGYTAIVGDYVRLVYGLASGSTEIVDARIGGDGVTYTTAGEAFRGQYIKLDNKIKARPYPIIHYLKGEHILNNNNVKMFEASVGSGSKETRFETTIESGTYNFFIETDFSNVSDYWVFKGYDTSAASVGYAKTNLYELQQSKNYYGGVITFTSNVVDLSVTSKNTDAGSYKIYLIKSDLFDKCRVNRKNIQKAITGNKNIVSAFKTDIYIGNMNGAGAISSQTQLNLILNPFNMPANDYEISLATGFDLVINKNGANTVVSSFPYILELPTDTVVRFMIRKTPITECTEADFDNTGFNISVAQEITTNFYELPVTFENGLFYGDGTNGESYLAARRIVNPIKTNTSEMFFIKIKAGYHVVLNDVSPVTGKKTNITLYNHFSYTTEGRDIRIGLRKNDLTDITETASDILKVYVYKKNLNRENYDITIAASDADDDFKDRADYVCNGTDDQFILQCAFYNVTKVQKVLLYPGNFYITEVRDNPANADGLFGHKVVFTIANPIAHFRSCTQIDGYVRSYIQFETEYAVNIKFTEECWNAIDASGDQVSVLGGENRNYGNRCVLNVSNVNFRGHDAIKPVCFVDGYYFKVYMVEKTNVMCRDPGWTHYIDTFADFTYIPNEKNIGFRGLQGSPYGNHHITRCLAWGCGVGYSIGGEHFILMDAGACFCGWGFNFSDYDGRVKMEHNITMIKCVISQCMHSIKLGRYGFPEDYTTEDPTELEKLAHKQEIECTGLQLESSFTTSGMSALGYEDGSHPTEGVYEVHNGSWSGTISCEEFNGAPVAHNCENIAVKVLDHKFAGTLAQRTVPAKCAPYERFYDIENNKEYIYYNGWREVGAAL